MTPCIANDSVGTIAPFIFALLLVPLSYMGICLMGYTIGSIGSRQGGGGACERAMPNRA